MYTFMCNAAVNLTTRLQVREILCLPNGSHVSQRLVIMEAIAWQRSRIQSDVRNVSINLISIQTLQAACRPDYEVRGHHRIE
jgi:hypothetical protein